MEIIMGIKTGSIKEEGGKAKKGDVCSEQLGQSF